MRVCVTRSLYRLETGHLSRWALAFTLALVACAPASQVGPDRPDRESRLSAGPKSITIGINEDPGNLWEGLTGGGGGGARQLGHLTNQFLVALRPDASPEPRLLAELPTLQNGLWTVSPDGKMQVTWKLRPGVTWHDATPFTADDLVFSWLVNRDPEVPNGSQAAAQLIERAEALDPLTVVATWAGLYPYADRLEHRELIPLPRHLLQRHYQEAKDQLLLQPYFSSEYVGLGPYRVERWERGSHLDLVAFDAYFLGRPRIDRIRIQFIPDDNTAVAYLQAGTVHTFLPPGDPGFERLKPLKDQWDVNKRGTMLQQSELWFFAEVQKSPARNPQPAALLDVRVRQALLQAIDRRELALAIFGELGIVADSWVHPRFSHYSAVESALTRYPYDPRRARALLADLGWRPGLDGVLERGGEKFTPAIRYRNDEQQATILQDQWKQIGVAATLEYLPDHLLRDRAARAQFSGFDLTSNPMATLAAVRRLASDGIPTPENRWSGSNRGSYASPIWDEVAQRLRVTLEDNERVTLERELVRIFSADLPLLPIYFDVDLIPVTSGLTGVQAVRGVVHLGIFNHTWNVHEWDVVS